VGFLKDGGGAHVDRNCDFFFALQVALPNLQGSNPHHPRSGHRWTTRRTATAAVHPLLPLVSCGQTYISLCCRCAVRKSGSCISRARPPCTARPMRLSPTYGPQTTLDPCLSTHVSTRARCKLSPNVMGMVMAVVVLCLCVLGACAHAYECAYVCGCVASVCMGEGAGCTAKFLPSVGMRPSCTLARSSCGRHG